MIAAITASVVGVIVLYGVQSIQRINEVEERWAIYNESATEGGRLLNDITRQMGYGGFIHNFKNYILRRDVGYVALLIVNRDAVYDALNKLDSYVITDEEKNALVTLRAIFDKYSSALPTAAEAFERGLSSIEVDTLVQVNDASALAAIAELNHSFLTRSRLAEKEISKAMEAATSMVWVLMAVVPVIVLLGLTLILFLRRIMDTNQNLSEVRDELAMLLRQAPDAILHIDSSGNILGVNDRAVELFGYAHEDLLTMGVEDLIPSRFRHGHVGIRESAFSRMATRPIGESANIYALNSDGVEIPVDISLNFMQSGGRRIAMAIVRDVTERKRAERELKNAHDKLEQRVRERTAELEQRTRELEGEMNERKRAESLLVQSSKMATIGEMASGITHELNQPMNIIRMSVEAAQIRIQRGRSDMGMIAETFGKVSDQILRMSDIINHMRVYSRQDTEGQSLFDPVQSVREGCKLFAAQLSGVDVELKANLHDIGPARVLGHATRLEQVMLNLLSNARDSVLTRQSVEGGEYACRIEVFLEQDPGAGELIISVRDNGGGIPEDVLPHIFAPFVTTKESGHGTGLGLSISYGIIEGMGGAIEAHNDRDGARFDITLPLAEEAQISHAKIAQGRPHQPDVHAPDAAKKSLTVLVVDDEVTAAHSLSDFLQDIGYLVYTAYNGEEAVQIYESDRVDAVITDLRMPVMDGEDLILWLREKNADLPIFAMTGHGPIEDKEIGVIGATEVWRKPLSLSEVASRMQYLCDGAGDTANIGDKIDDAALI